MYRLREMDVNDKVCEQVSMTMLSKVYPKDVIERCVQQSEPWSTKARRGGRRPAVGLVVFLIGVGLWGRFKQSHGGEKMVGKRSSLPPGAPGGTTGEVGVSGEGKALG